VKIKIFFLIIGIILFYPIDVHGQHHSKIDVIVSGGISIPMGPPEWIDNWKWGVTGGIGAAYRLTPNLSVSSNIDYYSFFFDDWMFNARLPFTVNIRNVEAGSSSIIGLSANVQYVVTRFSDNLSPFIKGGIGIQRYYTSDIRITEQTWEGIIVSDRTIDGSTSLGFLVLTGAGLNLTTSESRSYFIEVNYGIGFSGDKPNHFLPVKIGFMQRIR